MRSKGSTFNLHAYGAWEALFQYIVECHNHVIISGDEQGNRRSPIQVISHRAGTYLCLFIRSVVHAKVLDSVETPQKKKHVSFQLHTKVSISASLTKVRLIFAEAVHFGAEIKVLERMLWNDLWPDVLASIGGSSVQQGPFPGCPA